LESTLRDRMPGDEQFIEMIEKAATPATLPPVARLI
jgi:hypothetical protein